MSEAQAARILIADDEDSIRFVLREALEGVGYAVSEASDGDAAMAALESDDFDVAFVDVRMPGRTGLDVLESVRAQGIATSIVIITAQNTMENAVEAMKRGALDYLVKPFPLAEVEALAHKALRARALEEEVRALRREVGRGISPGGERLVGQSAALLEVFKTVGRVASRDVAVLVTGESGTGKELVARAIHGASPRAEGPFVPVNAAAIPRDLLESELFGHERGAFTGAVDSRLGRFREAAGGTLFLDEIGDMPLDLQAKVLRALQTGEVTPVGGRKAEAADVRIVAATNRDLDAEVAAGRFREDLLYRLRVVPIHLPPLRERLEDIRPLAEHFVGRYAQELGAGPTGLADDAVDRLRRHPWPGNVRELENAIKRALVLSSRSVLTSECFDFLDQESHSLAAQEGRTIEDLVRGEVRGSVGRGESEVYRRLIERIERPLIAAVLEHTDGNQIRAAGILGINRNTLRKKIVELDISLPGRERP